MKNTKKILTFLIAFALMACFTYVDAATYSAYKRGDKIEVKLNDTTTGKFYVLADSDATNNSVTAVYETTLGSAVVYGATTNGYDGSTAETTLKSLTSTWTVKDIKVRLLTAEEIKTGINFSKDTSVDFTEPTYLVKQNNFWLGDVAKDGEKSYPGIVNNWNTYSTITVAPEETTEAYIKPVITVSKEAVVGGVVEEKKIDYIAEWNKYVAIFKDNDFLKEIKTLLITNKDNFEITHTDTTLTVTVKDDNEEYKTNFTYKDGVITYVEYTGEDKYSFFDQMMIANATYALMYYRGFDKDTFEKWVDTEGLTLEKDGIEFKNETYKEEKEGSSLKVTYVKSFKADITHDFATYQEYVKNNPAQGKPSEDKKEDKTEEKNPKTGLLNYGTIVLASALVAGSVYVVVRKKNILPHA